MFVRICWPYAHRSVGESMAPKPKPVDVHGRGTPELGCRDHGRPPPARHQNASEGARLVAPGCQLPASGWLQAPLLIQQARDAIFTDYEGHGSSVVRYPPTW